MKFTRRNFLKAVAAGGAALPAIKILGCTNEFDKTVIFTVVGSMEVPYESSILNLFSSDEIKIRDDFLGLEGIPFITEIRGYASNDLEFLVNHKLITQSVDQIIVFPGDLVLWGEFWEEVPESQAKKVKDGISQTSFALRRRRGC